MTVEQHSFDLADIALNRARPCPKKTKSPRRYELDWLRVIIVLGAIVFHLVYEMGRYYPAARFAALTQVGFAFAIQGGLPLLFLIAGASAWLSLVQRTGRQFVKERVLHLLVPFIGCVLTIIPVTNYLASLIGSGPHIPFLQYYVGYFQGYAGLWQTNPLDEVIALWGNLWFIFVIFLFSLLSLPLVFLLKGPWGARIISSYAGLCRRRGGMLLPSLILIAIFWLLGAALPATLATSLWLTFLYALSFIAGLFLYAEPSIEQAIYRNGPVSLMAALLAFAAAQVLDLLHALPLPQSGGYLLTAILAGSFPWFGVIAFLGLAKRFLVANNAALDYLKEAVLPYFLLHMFILSAFGYLFLEHSRLPGALQGVIIISCTVASLALLFEFVIKRVGPLRFLFGMKARPRV